MIFPWPETLGSESFIRRVEETFNIIKSILHHKFLSKVLENKSTIRIIDVCSGIGVAGYALARILKEHGYRITLALVDIRKEVLLKAKEWIKNELGLEPVTYMLDIRFMDSIRERYDITVGIFKCSF